MRDEFKSLEYERALFDDVTAGNASVADVERLRDKYAVQARLYGDAEGRVERAKAAYDKARRERDDRKRVLASVALELKLAAEAAGVDPLGDAGPEGAAEAPGAPGGATPQVSAGSGVPEGAGAASVASATASGPAPQPAGPDGSPSSDAGRGDAGWPSRA